MAYEDNPSAQRAKEMLQHYLISNNPNIMSADPDTQSDSMEEARSIIDHIIDAVLYEIN